MQIRGRFKRRRRLTEPPWFEERVRQIARDERLHHHAATVLGPCTIGENAVVAAKQVGTV